MRSTLHTLLFRHSWGTALFTDISPLLDGELQGGKDSLGCPLPPEGLTHGRGSKMLGEFFFGGGLQSSWKPENVLEISDYVALMMTQGTESLSLHHSLGSKA